MALRYLGVLCIATAGFSCVGCGTLDNGRGWGEDATVAPGWRHLGESALANARQKTTWVPVALAGVFYLSDLDQDLSDWAVDNTPLFGSTERADEASDVLSNVLQAATLGSALVIAVGVYPTPWFDAVRAAVAVILRA